MSLYFQRIIFSIHIIFFSVKIYLLLLSEREVKITGIQNMGQRRITTFHFFFFLLLEEKDFGLKKKGEKSK